MAVLFVSQDYLIENGVIESNADYTKITPSIILAQELDLLPLLGSDLYNAMKTHVSNYANNATPIPSPYSTLMTDYIQKLLVLYIQVRITPVFKFKYSAKGIMVRTGDNSQPADTIDTEKLMDMWRNDAQTYAQRMVEYMQFNASTFPEYSSIDGSTYKIYPKLDAVESPIYLDGLYMDLKFGDIRRYYDGQGEK